MVILNVFLLILFIVFVFPLIIRYARKAGEKLSECDRITQLAVILAINLIFFATSGILKVFYGFDEKALKEMIDFIFFSSGVATIFGALILLAIRSKPAADS